MEERVMLKNIRIFKHLMMRDATVLKKDFLGDLINVVTWPTSLAITFGHVLPAFGMIETYGSFLIVGALGTSFFYLAVGLATNLINDFEGMRFIESQLITPVSSYKVVLMQRVTTFALHSFALSAPLLLVGKLLLGPKLSFVDFSLWKFMVIMTTTSFFFGFFALALAASFESTRSIAAVWRRIYTPMLLLGCYWFSFNMAQKVYPRAVYLTLGNPLTFIIEGIRVSVFGQAEYINFLLCEAVLLGYCCLLAAFSFSRIRRRLDLL